MNARRDEAGVVGKMVVVWLLFLVVIAVAAIDAASIAFTTYKLSDVGSTAASEGALVFKADHDVRQTCARVAKVVTAQEPTAKVARGGCSVEVEGRRYAVEGRPGMLGGISDFVYLPPGCQALVASSAGAELALPCAEATRRVPPA